jgi:hypothetical protein
MSKKLFVLVGDAGDGSFFSCYTFNEKWIAEQEDRAERGELDLYMIGYDGDGFHYDTLLVPDECTLESLGIKWDAADSE